MRWNWDPNKDRINQRKHGLSFDTARFVFEDPFAASCRDPYPHEYRWRTIGLVGNVIIIVVHTWPEPDADSDEEIGRIVSARKATSHERRAYEEGLF